MKSALYLSIAVAAAYIAFCPQPSAAQSAPTEVGAFLQKYCAECHSGNAPSGGWQLDELSGDMSLEAERRWSRVYDQLASGEMPPAEAAQPDRTVRASIQKQMHDWLHKSSLDRQREQGRVPIRRLNATEYENIVQELLHIDTPLKDLLPEDATTAGFDKVSIGLDMSATHFLRLQEAADRAISAALPMHPPIPFSDRRTGRDMTEKGPNFREGLGRTSRLDGDSLIFYTRLPRYGLCATAAVPSAGRYRVQMKAAAVGGKPIAVGLMKVMQSGREGPVLFDVIDVPSGEPQVITLECNLVARQAFVANMLTTWDIRRFKKPIEEYTGPGLMVEWMTIEGPIGNFPSPAYASLFDDLALKARSVALAEKNGTRVPDVRSRKLPQHWEADPLVPVSSQPYDDAGRLIRRFLPRAFRRPVTDIEAEPFVRAVQRKLDDGALFCDAMRYGYQLILTSPDFLFWNNSGRASELDEHALASRLAAFLWLSSPDEELLALADSGQLANRPVLLGQVDRMLKSARSERFIRNFTAQWLDLRKIDFTIPDPVLYADFDDLLLWSMPRETEAYFSEILRENRSVLEFVNSDWSMLNERLATLYGVEGVAGSGFRKVQLPAEAHRGGVMTQASVLKVTADGTRTSPVLRGAWVLDRIVGLPPSPPPPNIPPIEPDIRGATTIRQQLARHRDTPACATCHNAIDPPGFALESFDPIGNYRESYRVTTRSTRGQIEIPYGSGRPIYRGPDVEQGGVMEDGKSFKNIDEYKQLLLADQDQLARNMIQKLMIYATGGENQFADREVIEDILNKVRQDHYGLRTLIYEIVDSRVFRMR